MIHKFRAKRLKVKRRNQHVDVFIRHAAGKIDLALTSPVTVVLTYPISKRKRSEGNGSR